MSPKRPSPIYASTKSLDRCGKVMRSFARISNSSFRFSQATRICARHDVKRHAQISRMPRFA